MNDWEKLQLLNQRKDELRDKMKVVRNGISDESRVEQNKTLFDMITQTELYQNAKWILSYVSFNSEVDTKELLKRALKDGKKVYVPKIANERMNFFRLEDFGELSMNSMGILEPDGDPAKSFPYDLHLSLDRAEECVFFVPGLAFDKDCNRIGFGKGYYDKYLARFHKKMTVGLAFSEQIVDQVPSNEKDVALDLVVTPTGAYY